MDQHFCTACGQALGPGDLFCTACGVRAGAPTEPSVPPAGASAGPAAGAVAGPAAAPAGPPVQPVAETPVEVTAVRRPVPVQPVRGRRSRARFWGWIAVAAVLVGAVSYGLGTLADGGDDPHPGVPAADQGAVSRSAGATGAASPSTARPSPDPQALSQAKALHALIEHSAADKHRIAVAASQLQGCQHVAQAIATFEDAASSRDRLVDQASDLQVGLLPGGGAAVASFSQALRAAADADRAYVAWGQARHKVKHHHHTVCKGGKQLEQSAVRLSTASHAPKQRTADEWNVIAAQFGLPTIAWTVL